MYRISFFIAAILVICGLILVSTRGNQTSPLPKPPELHARDHQLSLTLHAVADSNGRDFFAYKGHDVAPILRVSPGDTLKIEYVNDLPAKAKGSCAISPCMELHPMNIHQVHFLAFEENQRPIANPVWLDTVNVLVGGSVDVIMDFTDPVIRGMSLFHCHLLNHEDKGMMAKIVFE